jgi:ClpP class serine protease
MADKSTKRYLELQMEELKATHGVTQKKQGAVSKKPTSGRKEDAEIAKLYEDAAEYQEELKYFEKELEVIKAHACKDILSSLIQTFPNETKNYAQELKAVVETTWKQFVEVEKSHPEEQLLLIQQTELSNIVEKLKTTYPQYEGDFEADVKSILIQRWETYIKIKKEHIKEETNHIKTLGLKPSYAERIYKRYHGIE